MFIRDRGYLAEDKVDGVYGAATVEAVKAYQGKKGLKTLGIANIDTQKALNDEKQTGFSVGADVKPGDNVTLIKYTAIASSLYHARSELVAHSVAEARDAKSIGWNTLVEEHRRAWQAIWDETDVVIEGDPEAQQGCLLYTS